MNRERLLLFIVLALFALALGYSYWKMPSQKRVTTLRYTQGGVADKPRTKPAPAGDDKTVHLERLERQTARFKGYRRNIFRPIFHEELKVPPPTVALPVPPPVMPPPRPVAPPPPPVPELTPLQRDMAQFTFLGFLKKDGVKTIFLARDKDIFLVKKGDKIAGKYAVAAVTDEALTIKTLDAGGDIIIPLVENRPLSAPKH